MHVLILKWTLIMYVILNYHNNFNEKNNSDP